MTETLGCPHTFELHREYLQLLGDGASASDGEVVDHCLASVRPGGYVYDYLRAAQVALAVGENLFVHGGLTHIRQLFRPSLEMRYRTPEPGSTPPGHPLPTTTSVGEWAAVNNDFARAALDEYDAEPLWNAERTKRGGDALFAWQSNPATGGRTPVVTSMLDRGAVNAPPSDVVAWLRASGVRRVLTGHKPVFDCPLIVNVDGELEVINGDLTRSDSEAADGRGVAIGEVLLYGATHGCWRRVHGCLRDGRQYDYHSRPSGPSGMAPKGLAHDTTAPETPWVGMVTADGFSVKAAFRDRDKAELSYLLTRAVDRREVRKLVTSAELATTNPSPHPPSEPCTKA